MFTNLYLLLGHWLMGSLPKVDDTHIKCATCGWESEHLNNLKFIYVGDNQIEGLCPDCYSGIIYYKKDWHNQKASPINLKFRVYFKGGNI